MTDREKLIEILQYGMDKYFLLKFEAEIFANLLIANGVTFATDTNAGSKWISVEDKMPHAEYGESDNVLAVDGHGIVEMLYFDGGCWCYPTGETVVYENPRWRITHWMPLPEPPKEG